MKIQKSYVVFATTQREKHRYNKEYLYYGTDRREIVDKETGEILCEDAPGNYIPIKFVKLWRLYEKIGNRFAPIPYAILTYDEVLEFVGKQDNKHFVAFARKTHNIKEDGND